MKVLNNARHSSSWAILPALIVGSALAVGCDGDDGDNIVNTTTVVNNVNSGNIYVSQNGANNAGTISVTDLTGTVQKTFATGGNEAVTFDGTNNILHNNDQSGAVDFSVIVFDKPARRASGDSFNSSVDGEIFADFTGNPKGSVFVASRGILIVASFNGRTGAGAIDGVSIASRGSSSMNAPLAFSIPTVSGGLNDLALGATTSPWDMDYDEANDRLFVVLTSGEVAVFDSFFASSPSSSTTASRFFRPTSGSVNLHGVDYLSSSDTLIVSDIGSAQDATDGQLFIVGNASTATGVVGASTASGSATLLGNPVDLQVDSTTGLTIIAEKSNDRLLAFQGTSLQAAASNSKPESLAFLAGIGDDFVDVSDTSSPSNVSQVVVVQNPGGNMGALENTIVNFNADLSALTSQTVFNVGLDADTALVTTTRSIENVQFDNRGLAYVTFGTDGAGEGAVGNGGVAVLNQAFRVDGGGNPLRTSSPFNFSLDQDNAKLTGLLTQLTQPKGIEITDSRTRGSRIIIAENSDVGGSGTGNGTPSIVVFGSNAAGNIAPIFSTTNLGSAATATTQPWDLDYEPLDDRLFVACEDGSVLVYNNFLRNGEANPSNPPGPDRVLTEASAPSPTNFHGIAYDRSTDTLIVSDVGDGGSATDGRLLRIDNVTSAPDSFTADLVITLRDSSANTLGNPVDIAFDGTNLYVADKNNSVVLRYEGFLSITVDQAPNQIASATNPESVTFVTATQATKR